MEVEGLIEDLSILTQHWKEIMIKPIFARHDTLFLGVQVSASKDQTNKNGSISVSASLSVKRTQAWHQPNQHA